MKKIAILMVVGFLAQGCASEPAPPLKSPCVGAEGSPCERHPINGRSQLPA